MIMLSQHLQRLLLDTDCVAVPSLGCFVVHAMPARYIKEDAVLTPPSRAISFHSMALSEDDRLTQAYMIALNITRDEAEKQIVYDVCQLKREIQRVGEASIEGVGTLSLTYNGTYQFTPNRNGTHSCQFLGLERIACPQHAVEHAEELATLLPSNEEAVVRKREWRTLRVVVKEGLKYAAIFIVMLLSYFMISYPIDAEESSNQSLATWSHQLWHGVNQKLSAVATAIWGLQPEQATNTTPTAPSNDKLNTPKVAPVPTPTTKAAPTAVQGQYTIVLASAITEKNAQAMVQRLERKGYSNVAIMKRKRMTRVVLGRYDNQREAHQTASQLQHTSNPDVMDAWVMAMPRN